MGGLVSRSALFYGKQNLQHWIHLSRRAISPPPRAMATRRKPATTGQNSRPVPCAAK